jgi:glycerol uptake facilitator-like aquaporin
MKFNLARRSLAEFLGTTFLLAVVVGSGIMGERLAGGNIAIALLANTMATGAGLVFLILTFGDISGAHFNPVVSLVEVFRKNLAWNDLIFYILAQISGGIFGTALANLMFELPMFFVSTKIRTGTAQLLSEVIATFGLIAVILATTKFRSSITPFAVAAFITSAYWFTSSTSFANPAVTIARSLSNTFAGIHPNDILPFILAQIVGAIAAYIIFSWLLKEHRNGS